jgi:hypothetical protein
MAVSASLLFVAADPTASQYEITPYLSYSAAFWLLVLVGIVLGQVVIFESAITEERHRYWKWGFVLLVAANAVLLLLPALRYHLYARGDMLTFIGMIGEIDSIGAIPDSNYYPNLHVLALTLTYVTGVEVTALVNAVPPLFSVLYMVSLYKLSTVLFEDQRKPLFVLPFGALLLYKFENLLFSPNVAAFMMVPFVFYLLFQIYASRSPTRFEVAFLLAVVAIVFYHPVTTAFLVGLFVALKLSLVVRRRLGGRSVSRENTPLVTASIAFVVFFSWYYSFNSIVGSTTAIVYALFGVQQFSPAAVKITSVLGRVSPDISDLLLVGIYSYGLVAALFGLGLVFVGYKLYLHRFDRRELTVVEAFLSLVLFGFAGGAVASFFVDFRFGPTRFLRYVRFAASILIGLGFYTLFRRVDGRVLRYLRPVVYVSFLVFASLSMFMLYGSPLSNDSNLQITEAEIEGATWLLEHRDTSMLIDELGISQFRIFTYNYEADLPDDNIRRFETRPPPHFTYRNASALDQPPENLPQKRYMMVTRLGRIENPRFYPQYRDFWRHTPQDFRRLERDSSVTHLYDGGELDAYLVRNVGASVTNSTDWSGANGTAAGGG